jgi:pimeloyl-ACP methyl ester carboxylesterase
MLALAFSTAVPVAPSAWRPRVVNLRSRCSRPPPHVARQRRALLCAALEPLEPPTTVVDAPTVVYKEWRFRGFRCCYAFAELEAATDAAALVLVHGFGANCRHWRDNIGPLAARGLRVYAIDLLGFGKGDMPAPGTIDGAGEAVAYDFDYWSAQLRQFCAEIVRADGGAGGAAVAAAERPPIFLAANSIGSMVTMQASIDEADLCRGHVFISPSLRQLNVRKRSWLQAVTAPIAMRVLKYRPLGAYFLKSLARPDALRKVLQKAYHVTSRVDDELVDILRAPALQAGALDVFLAFITFDDGPIPEDLLPQLDCPSLMLWGELDSFEPHRDGLALRHYATVERFVSLPNVGHCGHDEAPKVVNDLILDFVRAHL